jgi:integrin beta 8
MDGDNGERGVKGPPGVTGENGVDAPPGPPPKPKGFVLVIHSQSREIPTCPRGTAPIRHGYSFLHVLGNGHAHGQDLGKCLCSEIFYLVKGVVILSINFFQASKEAV